MPTITFSLTDEDVEHIADRVVEKLASQPSKPSPRLQPRPILNDRLQVSRVEAARMLGFENPITVDRLRARGLLRPNLATRRPMYPIKELERFIRECS
jgi:hypothetical protein